MKPAAVTVVVIFIVAVLASCGRTRSSDPISVCLARRGDDGLTVRFAEALEGALSDAGISNQTPCSGKTQLTLPHVEWEDVDSRTRVSYKLEVARPDGTITTLSDTCWETEFQTCARRVVERLQGQVTWRTPSNNALNLTVTSLACARAAPAG